MMRKRYTPAFKAQVAQELLKQERTLAQVAAEYGVHPTQLVKWRTTALEGLPHHFTKQDSTAALKVEYEGRLAALYEEIGRLTTQVAWLKRHSGLDPFAGGARGARPRDRQPLALASWACSNWVSAHRTARRIWIGYALRPPQSWICHRPAGSNCVARDGAVTHAPA
jgi:transposase-like protein